MPISRKTALFLWVILFFTFVNTAYASTFNPSGNMDSLRIMQDPGATTDAIRVTPANSHGISVNTFSSFSVTGKKLTLIHGGLQEDGYTPAKLIVIKSDSISVQHEIELLGEPADILFVDTSSAVSNKISCVSCKFTNFGRVTLAAATTGFTISSGMSSIGNLSTFSGGIVEANNLDAVGIQSLELIGESVTTGGNINTNMRANIDSNGGYTLSPAGKHVVASGGINIYSGTTAVTYEGLSVSARSGAHAGSALDLDGQYSAATVSIISTRPVRIKNTAKISTFSDIVATSVHQGNLIVPVEGVFVQTNRAGYSGITIDGQIQSDNKVQLVSPDDITLNKKIQGGEIFLVSGGGVRLTSQGAIESGVLTVGANWFSNQGYISANTVEVETTKTLYNHFGGKISGNAVKLVSLEGGVINGSRTNKEYSPVDLAALALSSQLTADDRYGVYRQVMSESGTARSNIAASIAGNTIDIKAVRFENINPYHLTKPTGDIWSNGIDLDVSTSRRVSVQAEQSLRIKAPQYILNSSAVMGLNQAGDFSINTLLLMNQRYRIEAELAVFSRQTYQEDGVEGYSGGAGTTESGIETYLTAYSPPGITYSFGGFKFSDGHENNLVRAEFINQFSFLEVSADAHFHDAEFQSIGLMMAGRPSHGYEPVRCAAYGCSAATYTSLIEYETLSSFAGTVYGISSNLKVATINQLDDAYKQAMLDEFIADYRSQVAYEDYEPISLGRSLRTKHYVSKVEISSKNGQDYLYFTIQKCRIYEFMNSTLSRTCNATQESFDVNSILTAVAGPTLVNGLEYSGDEIREKAANYIAGKSYSGNFSVAGGAACLALMSRSTPFGLLPKIDKILLYTTSKHSCLIASRDYPKRRVEQLVTTVSVGR